MAMRQNKSTNYFSHDSNARNDGKLLRLRMKQGAAGYGVYFMILERLREEANYMSAKDYNMIAFDLRVDAAIVKSVVEDFGLFTFTEDGKCFYSDSFTRRMEVKDELRHQRSEAGKAGMRNRWRKDQADQDDDKVKQKQNNKAKDKPQTMDPGPKPEPASQPTSQPADNQACLKRFFGKENASNLEVLLMNFGLKPDDMTMLRKMAKEVVAEWDISKKTHADYTDWSQHLIATMRIKVKDKQQAKGKTSIETEPPSTADYQYDGGFGSKDV